ncbi:MAG: glycosyltransferase family 39 protein, partial [Candidatus Methylomirabilis sp.]
MSPTGAAATSAPPGRISPQAAVAWLIAVSGLLRLVVAWGNGLCLGESYYFSCARHPSLSYFDHPPLSMLLGTLSLQLSGEVGRLALRWPFIVLFAGTTWLMFLLGRRLFGPWSGFHAALLLNLAPIFSLTVGVFFQPDGPLMFFSLACVWCLAHLLVGPPSRQPFAWWAAAGAMLGLAMLSKYAAVLLVVGAGLHVLTCRDQRRWLAHPGPYLALAIAVLFFSPVLVWNAQHQWASFIFQS